MNDQTIKEVRRVLLANLDAAYDKRGWHGPVLRGALRGVTCEQALRRPAPGRHNIWELTLHAAYWKYVAANRLLGGKRGGFPLKGSNWFGSPETADERAWGEVVSILAQMHARLRAAVESLDAQLLFDPKKSRMIYGVAAHDLYHTGQIQLVKRLVTSG